MFSLELLVLQQVNEEPSIGEDAFVWFSSLIPLAADVVNAQFTFETLTAPTANRLHFPAYDRFLKEMNKYAIHLISAFAYFFVSKLSGAILIESLGIRFC